VYKLSNTTIENLQTTCSVSTIGSSQSIPSIQAPKFAALIHQGVQEHTTHLNEKYKWLSMDYEDVTAWPNLPDIVHFEPYRPYRFVLGDHIWPQNASNKSATCTTNKASYQILIHRCEILQSTPFKEPNDLVGTTRQPMRLALIPNVTAWPKLLDIVHFRPYRPHKFVLGGHTWPQNASAKSATSTSNKTNY